MIKFYSLLLHNLRKHTIVYTYDEAQDEKCVNDVRAITATVEIPCRSDLL